MKKLLFLLLALPIFVFGQVPKCSTDELDARLLRDNPSLRAQRQQEEIQLQQRIRNLSTSRLVNGVITIPVVVNVLYHAAAENISLSQIQNAITVLDRNYNNQNPYTANVPSAFSSVVANVGIHFVLDTVIRKYTDTVVWTSVSHSQIEDDARGGISPTYPCSRINLYCINTTCFAGVSYLNPTCAALGEWATIFPIIDNDYFGAGRTITHEVGHFFGLYHTWGFGDCAITDYVDDTPPCAGPSYGCPTYPTYTTCPTNNAIMTMNYMDYTNDNCSYMFTNGQKARMLANFVAGGRREGYAQVTIPPCNFTYGAWGECINGFQARSYNPTPLWCESKPPADSIKRTCTPVVCNYSYGSWTPCIDGHKLPYQNRTYYVTTDLTTNYQKRPYTINNPGCNVNTIPPIDSVYIGAKWNAAGREWTINVPTACSVPTCQVIYDPWSPCTLYTTGYYKTRGYTFVQGNDTYCSGNSNPNLDSLQTPCTVTPCSSYIYGAWGTCINGIQRRTYSASPSGCNTNLPPTDSIKRTCAPSTCVSFSYGAWTDCVNGYQTRTFVGFPSGCATVPPADSLRRTCTITPINTTCTFQYSNWSTCTNGLQNRFWGVTPAGCIGTPPIDSTQRTCNTGTPCTSITYGTWGLCNNGTQTRSFTGYPSGCIITPPTDSVSRTCTSVSVPCTFSYYAWGTCNNGVQTRGYITTPAGCTGTPPSDSTIRSCYIVSLLSYDQTIQSIRIVSSRNGTLYIDNLLGQSMMTVRFNKNTRTINISSLPPGSYVARAIDRSIIFTK
jgi:hypothetical protein